MSDKTPNNNLFEAEQRYQEWLKIENSPEYAVIQRQYSRQENRNIAKDSGSGIPKREIIKAESYAEEDVYENGFVIVSLGKQFKRWWGLAQYAYFE